MGVTSDPMCNGCRYVFTRGLLRGQAADQFWDATRLSNPLAPERHREAFMVRPIVQPTYVKKGAAPPAKKSFIGMIGDAAVSIGEGTVGAAKAVGDASVNVVQSTVDVVTDPVKAVGDAATAVSDTTAKVVEGTVDVVTDPVKAVSDLGTAVAEGTVSVAEAVAEGTVETVTAVAEGTADVVVGAATDVTEAANAVVELSTKAIESTFEALGVTAAFQQVFGADIDKSDEGLEKAFAKVDADGSGKISSDEMREHITSIYGKGLDEDVLGAMMKKADIDGDGEVDLDEFKTIMRAGPDEK